MRASRLLARRVASLLVLVILGGCGDPPPQVPVGPAYDTHGRSLEPLKPGARPRPNVVLVVLDTLRADCLSLDAAVPGDMPRLKARAAKGVAFRQASSPASWTLPALTSMLTGEEPWEHRLGNTPVGRGDIGNLTTLAEILRSSLGYTTAGFFGGVGPLGRAGLEQGFDLWMDEFTLRGTDDILRPWLAERPAGRPFFLVLHVYDAHDPYGAVNHPYPIRPIGDAAAAMASLQALGPTPSAPELVRRAVLDLTQRDQIFSNPRLTYLKQLYVRWLWDGPSRDPSPGLLEDLERAYRQGVGWVDEQLDRTLELLESTGALKNTLLILTSDHGEAFGEHGMVLHGRRLDDELLRVPLVLWGPAPFDRPAVVDAGVGLTDIVPTVLDLLDAPTPRDAHGHSLLPLVKGAGQGHLVEAEVHRWESHTEGLSKAVVGSVRTPTRKFVATYEMEDRRVREELFDLVADPGERHDLANPQGVVLDVPGDAEFAAAVERVRDRVWGALPKHRDGPAGGEPVTETPTRPAPRRAAGDR